MAGEERSRERNRLLAIVSDPEILQESPNPEIRPVISTAPANSDVERRRRRRKGDKGRCRVEPKLHRILLLSASTLLEDPLAGLYALSLPVELKRRRIGQD